MTIAHIDSDLERLATRKDQWAALPIELKIDYLERIRDLVVKHGDAWVQAGAVLKGFAADSPLIGGEEWLGGPYPTAAWITDAIRTLRAIADGADPLRDVPVTVRDDGQLVLRVMPASVYDKLLLSGYTLDVWMLPDVTQDTLTAGAFHQQQDPAGRVTVVLGAGNVSAIPALDTLYAMFVHGDVVALKLNPVANVYGPVFEQVFAPLIADGYLAVVYGDGAVGAELISSELVDSIHITGSGATYAAISAHSDKPITSELGGVGPTIVVGGNWSPDDIAYQADHIATQKLHTSGHTCVASQVLILPAEWAQREQFLDAVGRALEQAPQRRPFYPGARERQGQFLLDNPEARMVGGVALLEVAADSDHPGFREEFFGPIYLVTLLPGATVEEYLANAVTFANERLYGNLGANLVVDPATAHEHADALDAAVADLHYGCIGVNAWSAVAFLTSRAAWGAFGSDVPSDIESGSGVVHNSLMLERTQKNVVQAPFRPFPRSAKHLALTMAVKPPWFLSNRTAASTARQFTHFAADPNPRRLPGLFASALRG